MKANADKCEQENHFNNYEVTEASLRTFKGKWIQLCQHCRVIRISHSFKTINGHKQKVYAKYYYQYQQGESVEFHTIGERRELQMKEWLPQLQKINRLKRLQGLIIFYDGDSVIMSLKKAFSTQFASLGRGYLDQQREGRQAKIEEIKLQKKIAFICQAENQKREEQQRERRNRMMQEWRIQIQRERQRQRQIEKQKQRLRLIQREKQRQRRQCVFTTKQKLQCSICHTFRSKIYRKLVCQHIFHNKCITKWCRQNNVCPLCRNRPSTR